MKQSDILIQEKTQYILSCVSTETYSVADHLQYKQKKLNAREILGQVFGV